MKEFLQRHLLPLAPRTSFSHPQDPPELVHLDSPALDVMTDFELVRPITITPDTTISRALERMKKAGVRLLLVTDERDEIIGMITAYDIQGEKPIKYAEEYRVENSALTVRMIMTPLDQIQVLNMLSVRDSQVGHIIETLRELEQQHVLAVEIDDVGQQRVRGLFSASQISKYLGRDIFEAEHVAHSLAEMVSETV
ncbi:MAG: CBS domain-containing protein [Gammaproteobacteria bacterium]|nr:CBS domain-containing protein [Gammaproteobacteria bacterium]